MKKNQWYVWVVMCGEDYGYGADYDGLWGDSTRVHETRSAACAERDRLLGLGCWTDDDDGKTQVPEFRVERMTIFRAADIDDIADEVREIMPEPGTRIPARVLRDAAEECGVSAAAHSRRSAALSGASSATHTHALVAGYMQRRGQEYLDLAESGRAVMTEG